MLWKKPTLSAALFSPKAWAQGAPLTPGGYKLAAAADHQPGSNKKMHSKQAFTYEHLYGPGDWNHPDNVDPKLPNRTAGHRKKSKD